MKHLKKVWNSELAGHPLNWLIVLIIVVLTAILVDSFLTFIGADKPVTRAVQGGQGAQGAGGTPNQPAPPT
jgi:Na+/citrate or Na+/malate symporter